MLSHFETQMKSDPKPSFIPIRSGLLQRCTATKECNDCRNKRLGLQRKSIDQAEPAGVPPIVHEVLRSPGQPLDAATRAFMEPRFVHDFTGVLIHTNSQSAQQGGLRLSSPGEPSEQEAEHVASSIQSAMSPMQRTDSRYDFSQVRIHADERAAASAQTVNALAYTVGRDVVFGANQYAPHTLEGRRLLAHELTHVVQQTQGVSSGTTPGGSLPVQRKVVLKGVDMPAKDRRSFLKAHKWTNASRAAAIMEDMAAAGDAFDFADENELKTEIDKRLSTVGHMEESQQTVEKIPGDKRSAFGYPFTGASALYGPRVNYAARKYWEPGTPDNYAVRSDKSKNKELMSKPRHQRCTVYGDQCDPYSWKLTDEGKKDPYHAIAYLFAPQLPHKRSLLHCDYLISLVNFLSLADSIGPAEFNKRIAAFGADKIFLKTNLLMDLNVTTLERDPKGEFVKAPAAKGGGNIPKKGLGSMQRVSPSSEADLVIGDHVIFYNHLAYDLINAKVGNAWRLENAVLVSKYKGKDIFLGHGSGYKTADDMRAKLAEEFNHVAQLALNLVAKTKSKDKTTQAAAQSELSDKFSVKPIGKEWHIQGTSRLLTDLTCPRTIDEKLREIKPSEVLGLKHPCNPTKMYEVERPIESAK